MWDLDASEAYSHLLDGFSILMGGALMWTGVRCFQDARALAEIFGVPRASEDEVIFFQSSTGRNIGASFFIWIMVYMGERRTLGIFMLCWLWAGIADVKMLYEHPRGRRLGMHIRNIVILLVVGTLLINLSTR